VSISGKYACIKFGGATLAGSGGFNFEEVADDLDATVATTASNNGGVTGTVQTEPGLVKATLRGTLKFDKTTGAYTPVRAGTTITSATVHDEVGSAAKVTITAGYVMRSSKKAETRGMIEVEFEVAANTYTVTQ